MRACVRALRACVHACGVNSMRACVRAYVRACVHACMRDRIFAYETINFPSLVIQLCSHTQ